MAKHDIDGINEGSALLVRTSELGPLLDLRTTDPAAFERVMDLVDHYRGAARTEPNPEPEHVSQTESAFKPRPSFEAKPEPAPESDLGGPRADYQRELMRERRAREYKALELHELATGMRLSGEERKKYLDERWFGWTLGKKKSLAADENLTWKERNEAARAYWAGVDCALDKQLEVARAQAQALGWSLPRRDLRRLE
jgi:hypothetical protein